LLRLLRSLRSVDMTHLKHLTRLTRWALLCCAARLKVSSKSLLTLLLPVLMLCAQQAAFVHVLSHDTTAQTQRPSTPDDEHPRHAGGPCGLCLAFAGVGSVTSAALQATPLLGGLSFALLAALSVPVRAASAPAQRNRGPPDLR
jgi:hypothetical protein